jgi:primosomal protein N' (replication factor Y)
MHVVTVAPISRGTVLDELSYFSGNDVPVGAIVSVPIRGRKSRAIVLRSVPAETVKSDIKSAAWSMRRLGEVEFRTFFSPEYMRAVASVADRCAGSLGATLSAVFPSSLFALPRHSESEQDGGSEGEYFEELIIQDVDNERLAAYKSLIREMFAKRRSVIFLLPSQQDIEHVFASLERGVREYTYVLHGGVSARETRKRWSAAIAHDHPVLIISTAYFLSIPRKDIGAIILDRESSFAYKTQQRPFADLRDLARSYAKEINARIVYGDIFLRVDTLFRYDEGEIHAVMRPKMRLVSTGESAIVDMREIGEQPATGRVAIYSPRLVDTIEENRRANTHLFILAVRKGYAPMTVCGDCGTILHCERCSAPMVLHGKKNAESDDPDRVFLCHSCGAERDAEATCSHCGGWRMVPLGIGIEQAEEAIKKSFPDLPVFRIDGDEVASHKEASERASEFFETPGSVLLGTEMALPYLTREVDHIAVLSVNSLLTIPDFRIAERVFRLLLWLRSKARRSITLQTRDTSIPFFEQALSGNIAEYYREELEMRKRFSYPPYSVLIKITFEGKRSEGVSLMKEVERIFSVYHPVTFPAFIARVKGKDRLHAIISVPREKWPDPEVLALLRTLPQELEVRVDPESLV